MSQGAHQAEGYPSFCSIKQLGIFLLHPGWDLSQGYPQHLILRYPFVHLVERGTVRVKSLAQEHNTMSPARALTLTAGSGLERTTMRPLRLPANYNNLLKNKLQKFEELTLFQFNILKIWQREGQ